MWPRPWGLLVLMLVLVGCSNQVPTHVYRPSQFENRLDWLKFCDHYYLYRNDICREDEDPRISSKQFIFVW